MHPLIEQTDAIHELLERMHELTADAPDELKAIYRRALGAVEDAATATTKAADSMELTPAAPTRPFNESVVDFYEHMIANLRWPVGYSRDHKMVMLHEILGQPTDEQTARVRMASWYERKNAEIENAA